MKVKLTGMRNTLCHYRGCSKKRKWSPYGKLIGFLFFCKTKVFPFFSSKIQFKIILKKGTNKIDLDKTIYRTVFDDYGVILKKTLRAIDQPVEFSKILSIERYGRVESKTKSENLFVKNPNRNLFNSKFKQSIKMTLI